MLSSSESDDDLYGGFNDYDAELDDAGLDEDVEFQKAVRTSYGNRPTKTAYKMTGRGLPSSMGRVGTASRLATGRLMTGVAPQAAPGEKRPMTAVKSAGFQSSKSAGQFDPLNQAAAAAPPLEDKEQESPEEIVKGLTKKVHTLLEESAMLVERGKTQDALEKAKEASVNERQLCKKRDDLLGPESANFDLTYAVLVHLANVYQKCSMWSEAVNTYLLIVKNKAFDRAGRLRLNIGNIYFQQKRYLQAVKMYRMALDQIPSTNQELRNRVMRNIGCAFVRMGQYTDAVTSFEHILDSAPVKDLEGVDIKQPSKDFQAGLNLVLCNFALGDRDKMCRAMHRLLQLNLHSPFDDERYLNLEEDDGIASLLDAIKNDRLRKFEVAEKKKAHKYITMSAKLISPVIRATFAEGFDWCVETIKSSPWSELAPELEITKALAYLKMKDFTQAVETLKGFEKKEASMVSTAATNLSFLYFLEGQYGQADKYADIAMNADRYNPYAMVNKGNCVFVNGEYDKAAQFYEEALAVETTCTEALYNLGMVSKKTGQLEDALDFFIRLHELLPSSAPVVKQIASLFEALDDLQEAIEWSLKLVSLVPTDAHALAHLGDLFDRDGDKSQAFQYHYEAYRYFPSDIDIISWLGAYYVDSQFTEKAIPYFERAAQVQPSQVKWRLMVASCHRRCGGYQQAMEIYKRIHTEFPENIECLRFLVRLCTDLGLQEGQEFADKLKKAEKSKELKFKRENSATSRAGSGRRSASGRHRSNRNSSGRQRSTDHDPDDVARRPSATSSRGNSAGSQVTPSSPGLPKPIDASYSDPIGQLPERPKTAMQRRDDDDDDDWGDDDDELLPE